MDEARLALYRILELVFRRALTEEEIAALRESEALRKLAEDSAGAEEMLAYLDEHASDDPAQFAHELKIIYQNLFIGPMSIPVPIWESVYFDKEHLLFGERTLEVREAYAKYGMRYVEKGHKPEDHLAIELSFMAYLIEQASSACIAAKMLIMADQKAFFENHLSQWTDEFARLLFKATENPLYRGATRLLQEFMAVEKENLGIEEKGEEDVD